ncbi:MAG: CinA family protein [Lachnospiraceae bacterium]|jgi:nicotinamide-nucleotide amidase|nr:CinA family protein [Lachnospiraceae bacterium]
MSETKNEPPETILVAALLARELKISIAESCTGGLVAKMITSVPGSSKVFDFGAVCYSDEMKTKLLDVSQKTLETYGAVSRETAKEMAQEIARYCGADIGVGITGIAGPGGGSLEKPVGLVYVAVYFNNECRVDELRLSGNREEVRNTAARRVLELAVHLLDI